MSWGWVFRQNIPALDVAQLTILKQLVAAETDPVWQQKLKDRIHELE